MGFSQIGSISKTKQPISETQVRQSLLHAEHLFSDSLESALEIIEKNLLVAIEENYKSEEALAYRILGDFNADLGNIDLALSNYKKSLDLKRKIKLKVDLYHLHFGYGTTLQKDQQYAQALDQFKAAFDLSKTLKNNDKELESLLRIAKNLFFLNQIEESKHQYLKAINLSSQKNKPYYKVMSLIGLAECFEKNNQFDQAKKYYNQAQKIAEQENFDELANQVYDLLTQLYYKENNLEQGIMVQQQAFNYNLNRGNSNSILQNSTNISQNYVEQGKTEEALQILNQSTPVLELEQNTEAKRDFIKTLSDIYAQKGLTQESEELFEEYNQLLDSFQIESEKQKTIQAKKSASLLNTQNKMLLMEKDRQLNEKMIEVLKKEKKLNQETIDRQATITYSLLGGLLIIGGLAFALYRNSRQKQKANNLLILKSLRNQMNPHFIFNSLNSVNSFIAKKDEKSANKYLAEFSKLMREVLECSQEDFISLRKEIDILKRYVNLEHFRFNSHFDFNFYVDDKINLDEYQIPPMLVQPFIENAIWHGLRYKTEKGLLDIAITQAENSVEITIKDDGIGREKSIAAKTLHQKKMKSTGIKNVENRLELIKAVFKTNLKIDISDNHPEGTIVKLKLL
ncbi:MAG: tetratricopeptide repeat-containing sensor histidine kinase [Putridiphycobacter sp.]